MRQVGDEKGEWSFEEKIERIHAAGFQGILGRLPSAEERTAWRQKLDAYQLRFGIEAFIHNPEEAKDYLARAVDFGVDYINAQVSTSFVTGEQAISLLTQIVEQADTAGIPFFVETHRGRITQDLLRTIAYVNQLPQLQLTIDFSHYVLAGEIHRNVADIDPYFEPLLRQTASIHGRISNGQQIQLDMNEALRHPMLNHFTRWWEQGMRHWLESASPGSFLPFVCEFGPPDYAITQHRSGAFVETSDRWQSALQMKRYAEQLWKGIKK
ncbi:sugar phosphate isomerase/epimerase [Xylanibacillus composti]|nr:sugar phosphate isomerase/epimerase [Xylanibacillus composti]